LLLKFSITGVVGSIGCLVLSVLFLFGNFYGNEPISKGTMILIILMLMLPAGAGLVAAIRKIPVLMIIVLIWSCPYGLYLTAVAIPSLWNFFGLILVLYLLSSIQMSKAAR
jgi:hypothetical protein